MEITHTPLWLLTFLIKSAMRGNLLLLQFKIMLEHDPDELLKNRLE